MGVHVNLELNGELGDYVATITDGSGWFANVEDYVRDLIRKDVERDLREFQAFQTELRDAFAAPESDAIEVSAEGFIAEMRSRAA